MNETLLCSEKTSCWGTLPDLIAALDKEFRFDLSKQETDKGLSQDWSGHRVFCNPPCDRDIQFFVRKAYTESRTPGTVVVMLIPSKTDEVYFHDYILNGKAEEVRFLRGRLMITDENGKESKISPLPSAVVIWRRPQSET